MHKRASFQELQEFVREVYGVPDDRLYSLWDLLAQQQRFSMRALKGIRKGDRAKLALNLLISLSWLMNVANRLHIDVGVEIWKRFPEACSYCGSSPCSCRKTKLSTRKVFDHGKEPQLQRISDIQTMFERIYPSSERTLAEAGVHLAEEVGEVNEAISNYLGQHRDEQLHEIALEMADLISCICGVANSADIDIAHELSILFKEGCHVCHNTPCSCSFERVASFTS